MTPKEAIKLLSTLPLASRDFEIEADRKAVKLGIEALKVIQAMRKGSVVPIRVPLPGETKE